MLKKIVSFTLANLCYIFYCCCKVLLPGFMTTAIRHQLMRLSTWMDQHGY